MSTQTLAPAASPGRHPPVRTLGDTGITVFTPYFAARTSERQAELDLCVRMNLQCAAVTRLVLLVDDGHLPPLQHQKLTVQHIPARPTYRQWLELSQALAPSTISILANSDIYFDESLASVHEALAGPCRLLALTRHEKSGETLRAHPNPRWSQDTWALRAGDAHAPMLPAPLLKALDIPLGVPRCDNKIAYLFAVHGWTVHNPMDRIRSVHVHETQQRSYDKKTDMTVMGGVAYVYPSDTIAAPSTLEFDVWARNAQLVKRVTLNRSMDTWLAEAASASLPVSAPVAAPPTSLPAVAASATSASGAAAAGAPAAAGSAGVLCKPVMDLAAIDQAMRNGELVYSQRARFKVYRNGGRLMAVDSLSCTQAQWLRPDLPAGEAQALDAALLLAAFVPPVVDVAPINIGQRPADKADCHFWQYPAATERQAWENHLDMARGANVDSRSRIVHTYLGLPWATYIDKKQLPDEVLRLTRQRLAGLHALARTLGHELRVHTVCQQIHWRRLVDAFQQLGVTDLHLSHATTDIDPQREGWSLRVHSWPLFAPNIEVPERRVGLTIGKPIEQKRYLASFIGAHMPHYRSDVRVRLLEAAKSSGRDDILVDLGNEWHFNKVVYKEQVQHKPLAESEATAVAFATQRYNEVLSDSVFSLCPEGAGPNTLRLWESLAAGAIPVIIADAWKPPTRPGWDLREACVFVVPKDLSALFEALSRTPRAEIEHRRQRSIELYRKACSMKAFEGTPRALWT